MLLEAFGLFLLTVCSIGRLWALLYISGHKTYEIITDGPYSIVRHPLYLFSLIGAIGIGMASENILIMAILSFFICHIILSQFLPRKINSQRSSARYISTTQNAPRDSCQNYPCIKDPDSIKSTPIFSLGIWRLECGSYGFTSFLTSSRCFKKRVLPVLLRVP